MNLKETLRLLIARFSKKKINLVLCGGLALSTMKIFRFTRDIDFLIPEESKDAVHEIMLGLDYELQDFSNDDIKSYISPLKVFGQIDFLLARRKYTRAMIQRARPQPIFDGELTIKTIQIEDLIGLKVQAIFNDPDNRFMIDGPDIQRLLSIHQGKLDLELIREYFRIFNREDLLNEWLGKIK